jgi:hypothetical protein
LLSLYWARRNSSTVRRDDQEVATMAGSSFQVARPMSISEITEKAQDFVFDETIAPKTWLRTGETLLREVGIKSKLNSWL